MRTLAPIDAARRADLPISPGAGPPLYRKKGPHRANEPEIVLQPEVSLP